MFSIKKSALIVTPVVFALMGGAIFSSPAIAADAASYSSQVVVNQPSYRITPAKQGDLITGGVVALNGASAKVLDGSLVVMSDAGQVLEVLPERVVDASGKPVGLLFDISDSRNVTFKFVATTKNRGFWECLVGIAGSAFDEGAKWATFGAGAGAATGMAVGVFGGGVGIVPGAAGGAAVGAGLGWLAGVGVGVANGASKNC